MEQHPIPQNVIAYKFHLVGNMTLKQFAELAFGLVGAWLVFGSNLGFLFKWTLGPFLAFLGFALAFLPIEDRPLDQWIINFFKSIYRDTQFIYQAKPKNLSIFNKTSFKNSQTQVIVQPPDQLDEYLKTLPPSPITSFEIAESKYLEHIRNLFGALGTKLPKDIFIKDPLPSPAPIKSNIKGVRIRKLMSPQMCLLPRATAPASPKLKVAAMPVAIKSAVSAAAQKPKVAATKTLTQPTASHPSPAKPLPLQKINVPQKPIAPVAFATGVTMPQSPEKPNLISGITVSKAGKIISNAILEIKDSSNHSVRALKSNKLGQFFIATPLTDGVYKIETEHSDYPFATIKLEVKNEIIPPLKIQALK